MKQIFFFFFFIRDDFNSYSQEEFKDKFKVVPPINKKLKN
jgi:hypothetical protein